jgi:hypothetical protein
MQRIIVFVQKWEVVASYVAECAAYRVHMMPRLQYGYSHTCTLDKQILTDLMH